MTDWEAAIIAYIALALVAETQMGEAAVFIAWGIAVEQVMEAASGQNFLSGLLGKVPWPGFKSGSSTGSNTNASP